MPERNHHKLRNEIVTNAGTKSSQTPERNRHKLRNEIVTNAGKVEEGAFFPHFPYLCRRISLSSSMSENNPTNQPAGEQLPENPETAAHSDYQPSAVRDAQGNYQLTGMYRNWFLDYASYVILERAVPHLGDGLKPVQRRILHSMKRLDDGRFNKVANIVGHTMQFHPHGDASIGDALVQLGQKNLLVDCQGNWGNILTGDGAAAPRYIEARLSKFALDVLFNTKTKEWKLS